MINDIEVKISCLTEFTEISKKVGTAWNNLGEVEKEVCSWSPKQQGSLKDPMYINIYT